MIKLPTERELKGMRFGQLIHCAIFDDSELFKKIYEEELIAFKAVGGEEPKEFEDMPRDFTQILFDIKNEEFEKILNDYLRQSKL